VRSLMSEKWLIGVGAGSNSVKLLSAAITCILVCCAAAQSAPDIQPDPHLQLVQQPGLQQNAPTARTPNQTPAMGPQVLFKGGILTITSIDSTLGEILSSVHQQTGAVVDIPENLTERVAGHFGPGPARDVLVFLLNGTKFNYVLLGSATNPSGLERVILSSKPREAEEPAVRRANDASAHASVDTPVPLQTAQAADKVAPTPSTVPPSAGNSSSTANDAPQGMLESPDN